MKKSGLLALVAAPMILFAAPAQAQESAWELDAELGVFSDYRFRGVSLSGKDPQVTAEFSVGHSSGLYAGTWLSNVDLGDGADDLEVDLYAGYVAEFGAVTVDVGVLYYLYPGNGSFDYVELYSTFGASLGPADLSFGLAYAPSQDALGNTDNTYVFAALDVPVPATPLTLHGHVGFEDGAFGNEKTDWLLGVSADLGMGFTGRLDYVDTRRSFSNLGDATVVASLTFSF